MARFRLGAFGFITVTHLLSSGGPRKITPRGLDFGSFCLPFLTTHSDIIICKAFKLKNNSDGMKHTEATWL